MLEWMQRHKKYLVVTIWISVIALVAAGMVGWNPSSFSLAGDNVAKVGDTKITIQEFQNAYQRTFNEYSQILGGELENEQAKSLGIDKIALKGLIQKAQLQNFATELGLIITDQEVVQTITQDPNFQKNGVFDENLYRTLLRENGLSVKFFEQSIRTSLLIQKLLTLFPASTTALEKDAANLAFKLTDTIEYKILSPQPLKQTITTKQIQDFWEQNKDKYTNDAKVTLQAILIDIDKQPFTLEALKQHYDEDKSLYLDDKGQLLDFAKVKGQVQHDYQSQEARKEANRINQKFKAGESTLQSKPLTITLDKNLNEELASQLQNAQKDSFIKPAPYGDKHFIIAKVIEITPQSIKTFQEAKAQATAMLKESLQEKELQDQATQELKTFKGKTAQITPMSEDKIGDLNAQKSQFVIRNIFASTQNQGAIPLDKSIFIYRIIKQTPPTQMPSNLIELAKGMKSQYLDRALMEHLAKKYPIKIYNNLNLE